MMLVDEIARVVVVGVGATAVMDAWTMILKGLGIPTLDYAWLAGGQATCIKAGLRTPASSRLRRCEASCCWAGPFIMPWASHGPRCW
jgi:hypothetical protein